MNKNQNIRFNMDKASSIEARMNTLKILHEMEFIRFYLCRRYFQQ